LAAQRGAQLGEPPGEIGIGLGRLPEERAGPLDPLLRERADERFAIDEVEEVLGDELLVDGGAVGES
jgi:hypothetical protein